MCPAVSEKARSTPSRSAGLMSAGRRMSPATLRGRGKEATPAPDGPTPRTRSPRGRAASPATAKSRGTASAGDEIETDRGTPQRGEGQAARVTVAVRIRPDKEGAKTLMRFGRREENALRFAYVDGPKVDEGKGFAYDHVFDSDTQADVYRALGAKVLEQAVMGHNTSVFAYGQTGSGKTYTMLGTPEERGLIPRLCEGLFEEEALKTWNVTVSFFEIYNEQVVDLLNPPSMEDETSGGSPSKQEEWTGVGLDPKRKMPVLNALRVREGGKQGVYVEGLLKVPVTKPEEIELALERGSSVRRVAETAMNAESSRSHAIVQLCLAEAKSGDRTAVLNLIDLAGSENVGRSRSNEDQSRMAEAKSINKSLLGLGKCITQLAQGSSQLVPYRDSTLTWILKDALGGNSHTIMICAVDPSPENAEQTLTTLRYADQAKKIQTRPIENIDHAKKMVRELHEQVASLRVEAEAAAAAQAAASAKTANAEAAAAAASQAAADARAEREEAQAAAMAARDMQAKERAEVERWKSAAEAKERMLNEREEALRAQAAEAAEAARLAEERLAAERSKSGGGADGGTPGPFGATDVAAAVATMSREQKIAFIKQLKEERKALHVELGIEPDPPKQKPQPEAAAAVAAEAAEAAIVSSEGGELAAAPSAAAIAAGASPQPPLYSAAFKCLGFVFAVSVSTAAAAADGGPAYSA